MASIPGHPDDKVRFTPDHQLEWDDPVGISYDFQADFEVSWGDGSLESFFE